ncbi:MAG: hypothetical protein H0T68_11295 [Gemmatimonadales bacterium]|nr:hypothetical protein [Gemmatimonadales bacterium]MBA3555462.1 hypothetical protein [Gemmatimonadales bacterium]
MQAELLVLRLVHVLGGIFWVGSGLFTTLFLVPVLASSGATAGQVMAGLQQRRLFSVLPTVAFLTILSGLRLMWLTSAGFSAAYFAAPSGLTYAVSGLAATVAFVLALLVVRPAAVRSASLAASLAAADETRRAELTAELGSLRRRGAIGSTVVIVLLVLGAAGMAVARYV